MYLPRELLSHLYTHLQRTTHQLSPPVLILSALDADALCATRILTALLKGDFIPHKIQPVSGYADLLRAGRDLVRPMRTQSGGEGGVVVCLGLGATMDLEEALFGSDEQDDATGEGAGFTGYGGVECWVIDARRPWDLSNVFGASEPLPEDEVAGLDDRALVRRLGHEQGRLEQAYKPGKGGIVCFDDGDIDGDLAKEREAYHGQAKIMNAFDFDIAKRIRELKTEIEELGGMDDDDDDAASDADGAERIPDSAQDASRKRKASFDDDGDSEDEDGRAHLRRRSNSVRIEQCNRIGS
jgi:cell division control protein 45